MPCRCASTRNKSEKLRQAKRVYCLVNIADNDAGVVQGRERMSKDRTSRWTLVSAVATAWRGFSWNEEILRLPASDSTSLRHQTSVAVNRFSVADTTSRTGLCVGRQFGRPSRHRRNATVYLREMATMIGNASASDADKRRRITCI